ncbi:MAG: biotin--[acetyl-CoA-carboxylase] ligase [Pseudomonadota bacterium]
MTSAELAGPLTVLDTIDSTSEEARRHLAAGETGPFWIAAREQTKGRGRQGKPWSSKSGNLAVTGLIPFKGTPAEAARAGFAVSLGVAETVLILAHGASIEIKWPNDVLLDGKKVSGILLENLGKTPDGRLALTIGIGINLAHHPDAAPGMWPPTSLAAVTGAAPAMDDVLPVLIGQVSGALTRDRLYGFEATRAAWLARAARLGEVIDVKLSSETLRGTFRTIDHTGALVLQTGSGLRSIAAADVFFPETTTCS